MSTTWDDTIVGMVDMGVEVPVVWSTPEVGEQVVAGLKALSGPTAAEVAAVLAEPVSHDSLDREGAFDLASKQFGIPYNDIYDAWLEAT